VGFWIWLSGKDEHKSGANPDFVAPDDGGLELMGLNHLGVTKDTPLFGMAKALMGFGNRKDAAALHGFREAMAGAVTRGDEGALESVGKLKKLAIRAASSFLFAIPVVGWIAGVFGLTAPQLVDMVLPENWFLKLVGGEPVKQALAAKEGDAVGKNAGTAEAEAGASAGTGAEPGVSRRAQLQYAFAMARIEGPAAVHSMLQKIWRAAGGSGRNKTQADADTRAAREASIDLIGRNPESVLAPGF
jgi:hypothetical protein